MPVVDLTNCDTEPIHIPGKIQGHGFLVSVDKNSMITECSQNIADFLPTSPAEILGRPLNILDNLFGNRHTEDFIKLLQDARTYQGSETFNPYPVSIDGKPFNQIIHLSDRGCLIEFEPESADARSDTQRILSNSLSVMLADADLSQLLFRSAEQIRNIIDYDRVMIYKFHTDGHGEVVAEAKDPVLAPFLGLHYPASDIPRQARELYKLNLTRLIADVHAEPSAILGTKDFAADPLDLTYSVLRAVSPIHIQYLKNMGVASSFSISLLSKGKLWGLAACHHYTPRFINYKLRESAKFVGQILSSSLNFRQAREDEQKKDRLKRAVNALTRSLHNNKSLSASLFEQEVTILQAVESTGAVLSFEKNIYTIGNVPDQAFIAEILGWLDETMDDALFETDRLPLLYPPARLYTAHASGLLACRLSKELKEYILWFRPEIPGIMQWAGNPEKLVETGSDGTAKISPRTSFENWSQTVLDTAAAWNMEDRQSALHLKEEIVLSINRKATEIRLLNEKLKEAYDELNTFSYTISHDLKGPLTSIKGYAQLLQLSLAQDPTAEQMIGRIIFSVEKMQSMIRAVLEYSQLGQEKTEFQPVNMRALLSEIREELLIPESKEKVRIVIKNTPDLLGEKTMMMQVFSNLLGNAVKYSQFAPEALVTVNGEVLEEGIQYSVTDNGIGIKTADHDKVFGLFARSDEVKNFEGSGVGLAIVKKIVEQHHGKIWIDNVQTGTTFNVFFKNSQ